MERLRRRPLVIALRVAVVLGFAGCSNQQMSASNPFMAPDRVPPPATRTIAPGTAAPYYPGDPVPAAQNVVPGQPTLAQVPVMPVAPPTVQTAAPATSQPLAFSNERTVAIPSDNADLRFAVPPAPATEMPAATASAAPQVAAAPQSAVIPAAYNQSVAQQPAPAASPIPAASDVTEGGPWRSPQIPGNNSAVMQAQYVQPQAVAPTVLAAQPAPMQQASAPPMPVELRAVPAPTTGPMMAPMQAPQTSLVPPPTTPPPRMRFPSWTEPSTWFTPQPEPAANQQLIGYMVPGPNGQQQMISVEQYQAMISGTSQPAASVATSDGFRARGTSTK